MLLGSLAAGLSAYAAAEFLARYFETHTLTPFAIYCLVAGFVSLIWWPWPDDDPPPAKPTLSSQRPLGVDEKDRTLREPPTTRPSAFRERSEAHYVEAIRRAGRAG